MLMKVFTSKRPAPRPDTRMGSADGKVLPITTAPSIQFEETSSRGSKPMSDREREVLALVAEGCSNQEIAVRLSIARGTVRVHLYHIFRKLCVRRRTEAAIKYLIASDALRKITNHRHRRE
jgi:DNA-binding NarL/FixJ family response regulator